MVKQLFTEPLSKEELGQLDTALLNPKDLAWTSSSEKTTPTIEQLQAMSWNCEEHGQSGFVLCRRPT